MQTTEVFAETARWLRYAEEDLITAETLLAQAHIPPRQACWHAQQATEKALKAVLIFLQIDFSRTHDGDQEILLLHQPSDASGPNGVSLTL